MDNVGYLLTSKDSVYHNLKLKIGKSYNLEKLKDNELCFQIFNDISFFLCAMTDLLDCTSKNLNEFKIFEVSYFNCDHDESVFILAKQIKILKEIDYENVKIYSNNEDIDNIDLIKQKIFDILIFKRDKDFQENMFSDDYTLKLAMAKVGNNYALDHLIKETDYQIVKAVLSNYRPKDFKYVKENLDKITYSIDLLLEIGRKEDLDWLLEESQFSEKDDWSDIRFKKEILKHGYNDHLDYIIENKLTEYYYPVSKIHRKKDLELFVNSVDLDILKEVVLAGRQEDLDKLVLHPNYQIRKSIAKLKIDQYLDILVYDRDYRVRKEVARQKRDKNLDVLVNDKDQAVRVTVAEQGREKDLLILKDDIYNIVSSVAKEKLRELKK